MAIPSSSAAAGLDRLTGFPWKDMVPDDGAGTPANVFTRVDLPAPLSPTSAHQRPPAPTSAHQRHDFTGMHIQFKVGQGGHCAEGLGNTSQTQQKLAAAGPFPFPIGQSGIVWRKSDPPPPGLLVWIAALEVPLPMPGRCPRDQFGLGARPPLSRRNCGALDRLQQFAEPRRRHASLGLKLPVDVRYVVETG